MIGLVLGGVRSGKSAYAENWIQQYSAPWIYLATGRAWDEEMQNRIAKHQERRDHQWETIEEPLDLVSILSKTQQKPVLIDCLTLWVTNLLMEEQNVDLAVNRLADSLHKHMAPVIMVSSEVGLGIVPVNPLARQFCDYMGMVNQKLATISDKVTFIIAGLPMILKDSNKI